MAVAVCSSVSGTTRVLVRGIATGRVVSLRLGVGVHAVGVSGFKRRFHISPVSQGLMLRRFETIM